MKYLVDTDWVIEYLKGREPVVSLLSDSLVFTNNKYYNIIF